MRLPLLSIAFLLAACEATTPPAPAPAPAGPEDACGAADLAERFVGQDADVLAAATFPAPVRVIRPGDVVTQDFNPERLNFDVDANGVIAAVRCG